MQAEVVQGGLPADRPATGRGRLAGIALALALLAGVQLSARAADGVDPPPGQEMQVREASATSANGALGPRSRRSPVVARVAALTRELDLDVRQQALVKTILEDQRAGIARVWSDPSVPSAQRIGATQAIGEKTADRIRATLNEAQRGKYIRPHQHAASAGVAAGDLQKWIQTAQGQERPPRVGARNGN